MTTSTPSRDAFLEIKSRCNGMLPVSVYERIYECARRTTQYDLVEVGTAHGAATVCLALGMRHAQPEDSRTVHTFEKVLGGSRERFGDVDKNQDIIRRNFKAFDVDHAIDLLIGDVQEQARAISSTQDIALLMLDADGRIDRDFMLFYNRLRPGAPVIIDDYVPKCRVIHQGRRRYKIDLKQRLTFMLANYFVERGLLVTEETIGSTLFCRKPESVTQPVAYDLQEILDIYRSLVFVEGVSVPFLGRAKGVIARHIKENRLLSGKVYRVLHRVFVNQ